MSYSFVIEATHSREAHSTSGKSARNTLAGQVYRKKKLRNCTADLIKTYFAQEVISIKFVA